MLRRIAGLFGRYTRQHGRIKLPSFELQSKDEALAGMVEIHEIHQGRYIISGWVDADEIGLRLGASRQVQTNRTLREDVLRARPDIGHAVVGFRLDLPYDLGQPLLWFSRGPEHYMYSPGPLTRGQLWAMRRRMILPFLWDLTKASPAIAQWFLFRSPTARARVKAILGVNEVPWEQTLNQFLFDPLLQENEQENEPKPTGISIIMPVYNAFDLLDETLDRVVRHTDLPWRLIVIEDCSDDDRVRPWLRQWHGALEPDIQARVTLLENEENQGFIRSVNQGFARALPYGDHVVLLNSDALVPPGWASRLIRPLGRYQQIATVTPMSNDAEIFTVPVICARGSLAPGQGDKIDGQARRFNLDVALKDAPTGVGFCMAMHIDALRQVPEFDVGFGRGYGEEVDWCRKLAQRGWRHLGHGGVFVEHRGGASFGEVQKRDLVQANNRIISRRYPDYDRLVQDFITSDPLGTPRLAQALVWAGQRQAKVPVYLAHNLGGGAEHYLERRIAGDLDAGTAVVLRAGGARAWQIELHSIQGLVRGETDDTKLVRQLLQLLPHRAVIYSCGVGAHDPLLVPKLLGELGQGHSLEIQFHDFWPISPSYTLLNSAGVYQGLPDPAGNTDRAHEAVGPGGVRIDLADWQQGWGCALEQAGKITVFSDSSKALVAQAYPQVVDKIEITPHHLLHDVPQVAPGQAPDGVPVIGVLGNIGVQKGAAVLRDLSRYLARENRARLVLIGSLDPAYALAPPARVHGNYELRDIPALIKRYGISRWLIPSIWPETFSYATHEAIATGLPVWCFDLGAQAQAVAAQEQGGVIPLGPGPVDVIKLLDLMLQSAQEHA
ncbi:Glycosyltransferase [hydrothermal vent metagenome]|uniref:Glycosyltransferase n=1 Tax=hydrothermal vent metagenome TaxID=652676 RepID=A0A3B0SMU8_9ZZZZ